MRQQLIVAATVCAAPLQNGHMCAVGVMIILGMISLVGCGSKPLPPEALTVVISGDTAGWIVPCGCTSNQSGGLARRGSFIRSLRNKGAVLVADVGGAAVGTSPYDQAKFEAILAGEMLMGLVAHNIGTSEAKLGADYLRELAKRSRIPFVSCNVTDNDGRLVAESHRIAVVAQRRVALVGVLSDTQFIRDLKIEAPRAAVLSLLPKMKGQYDHLIVLAYVPEAELRTLAAALPEADAVVGGPTGQSIAPEKSGATWLAAATNKGKFVISLTAGDNERKWRGAVHELNEQFEDDGEQRENVTAFHRLLAERDFTAQETSFSTSLGVDRTAGQQLVGSERCVDCHTTACDTWRSSKHATAWQSLTKTGSQVDSYCQQCHTNGFGQPGGFESVTRSQRSVGVGCEDCHGAGSAHVAEPTLHTVFYKQAQFRCERCHDRENSPQFSYETYWPRIEHGGKTP